VIRHIFAVGGRAGVVRRAIRGKGKFSQVVLSFSEPLPEDLAPMLILDASGRTRSGYKGWIEEWQTLRFLKTAPKDYANVTVHLADHRAGRGFFQDNTKAGKRARERALDACATLLQSHPDGRWLVIHLTETNVDRELRYRVADRVNMKACTWGRHRARNDLKDRDHILVLGFMFLPPEVYEARTRTWWRINADTLEIGPELLREITLGETRDQLLQGLTRGTPRLSIGSGCKPCDIWIMLPEEKGITPDQFNDPKDGALPGCKVVPWHPFGQPTRTNVVRAGEYIIAALRPERALVKVPEAVVVPPGGVLLSTVVQAHVGVADGPNFRKHVRNSKDLAMMLNPYHITQATDRSDNRVIGWQRLEDAFDF
jgi:hypothetical protein